MKATTLDEYFCAYGGLLQQNAQASMDPLFVPGRDEPALVETLRRPFPKQHDLISGAVRALKHNRALFIIAECGTGKTTMGALTAHAHAKGKPYRAIVCAPPQLVGKWEREIREMIPGCKVIQLEKWVDVAKLDRRAECTGPEWYVISRERAKLGAGWKPAIIEKNGKAHCPRCGTAQIKNDTPLALEYFRANHRQCECGEQLWQYCKPSKTPRWEPARYIKKHLKGFFRYLILDEAHELKGGSDVEQANAAGSLIAACRYTIAMTGTFIGGYADNLRSLLFRMNAGPLVREGFEWSNPLPFTETYGRIETRITTSSKEGAAKAMGRGSSRSTMRICRPGIVPTLLKHLIGNTLFLSLSEVADQLPELHETLVPVPVDPEVHGHYKGMEQSLLAVVRDRFSAGAKKMLGPMVNGLLHWIDHPFGWKPLGYMDGNDTWHTVHQPAEMDRSRVWPKEQMLIDLVQKERSEGRQVWVYVDLTDTYDVAGRLSDLFAKDGLRSAVLRSSVVPVKREDWIRKHAPGLDVCISHPDLVKTGLDLFDKNGAYNFSTLIFYE